MLGGIMDMNDLSTNLGLEKEECVELVELLIKTSSSDLGKLHAAIEERDAGKTATVAHSMKGAAGNLGFQKFYEVAKKIEEDARKGILEGAAEGAQALERLLKDIETLV
jgi:histidine phosphotransfer protein HptB